MFCLRSSIPNQDKISKEVYILRKEKIECLNLYVNETHLVLRRTQESKDTHLIFYNKNSLDLQRQKSIWSECSVRRRTLRKPWNARYGRAVWTPVRCSSSSPARRSSGAVARAPATRDRRRDASHPETRPSSPRVRRMTTSGPNSEVINKPNEELFAKITFDV